MEFPTSWNFLRPFLRAYSKCLQFFHGFGGSLKTGWWFQIFVIFTPILGEMIHFDQHIVQMGGSTTN